MNKETSLSLLRSVLTVVGTYLIGRNLGFLGAITTETWQIVLGAIMTGVGVVWGFRDKTITSEKFESGLRSIVLSISGFLIAAGLLTNENRDAILGLITAITPVIMSKLSRDTNKKIADPNISVTADPKTGKVIVPTAAPGL